MKRSLILALLAVMARAETPDPLEGFRWKSRVLVVATPSLDDARYARQAAALLAARPELAQRHIEVVVAPPGDPRRARWSLDDDAFAVMFVGLDGGLKFARREVLPSADLFAETDRESTRQSELRNQVMDRNDGNEDAPLTIDEVRSLLQLEPETSSSGWFEEIYRSAQSVTLSTGESRAAASTINYLYAGPTAVHRLQAHRSDEIYHFLAGDPVEVLVLPPEGAARIVVLGTDFATGQVPQVVLPTGAAYTSRPRAGGRTGWSLIGATVVPGWALEDVIRPDVEALVTQFPEHAAWIRQAATAATEEHDD